jgi:tetratricopeptide (TPR) repeat protein
MRLSLSLICKNAYLFFMVKEKIILILFLVLSKLLVGQDERAFELYSAGVRAGHSYEFGVAIMNYTEAIKLKPDYMMAYFNRGAMFIKTHENDNTIADMQKVLSLDSTYYDAYAYLGEAYIGKSDIATAKKMYEFLLKKIPNHKKGLDGMALCYFYLNNYEESIRYYDKYIDLVYDDAEAYYKRGIAKFSLEQYQKSIDDFTKAISFRKEYWQALDARAKAYRFIADLENACIDWHRSLQYGSKEAEKNIPIYCTK